MPFVTSDGTVYYGAKQKTDHVRIPEPPNDVSRYDVDRGSWVDDPDKVAKKKFVAKKFACLDPITTTPGVDVVPDAHTYFKLTAIVNNASRNRLTSVSIRDYKFDKKTVSLTDAEKMLAEIEDRIVETLG